MFQPRKSVALVLAILLCDCGMILITSQNLLTHENELSEYDFKRRNSICGPHQADFAMTGEFQMF